MTSKRPRLFYGWLIVLVSAVGLFLGAPLVVTSFSVFLKSLATDFHANRASISFAFSLFNTLGALWLPVIGMLIDRFGARRVVLPSIALYGVVLIAALSVGRSLWQLYLFYALCIGPVRCGCCWCLPLQRSSSRADTQWSEHGIVRVEKPRGYDGRAGKVHSGIAQAIGKRARAAPQIARGRRGQVCGFRGSTKVFGSRSCQRACAT